MASAALHPRPAQGRLAGKSFAHRTQIHGDVETDDTTAYPQDGTSETGIASVPENCTKTRISHPQRRWRFQSPTDTSKQRRSRFQPHTGTSKQRRRRFHARDFRFKRAMASPDQHTFACNSATDTSDFRMQSLKFRAFHGAADWRRQGIACETAKQSPHAPPAWRAPEGPAAVPPRGLRDLAGQRAYAPSEARSADGSRADRMARRPEIRRGNKQQAGRPLPTGASSSPARRTARPAPGTPAAPQATTRGRAGHAAAGDQAGHSNAGDQAEPHGTAVISGSRAPSGSPTRQQHPPGRAGAPNRRRRARGPRPRR